ncbi:MAG TPA: DUF1801 domain-containing protein [Gemmatimonadales bacterium]|nr:DUF1801 domain-containing protein [Gemmatimonadales bacterium]
MAENKTQQTKASVDSFVNGLKDKARAADSRVVLKLMQKVTGESPKMWGPSIVGFGTYHYKYDSGREGDFLRIGFSPRAQALTLYIMGGFPRYEALMARLGKFKTGQSCLYIKQLSDVDLKVLEELILASWQEMAKRYPLKH